MDVNRNIIAITARAPYYNIKLNKFFPGKRIGR